MFNTSTKVCTLFNDMYKDGSMYELRTLPYASRPANIFVKEKAAKKCDCSKLGYKEILKIYVRKMMEILINYVKERRKMLW